jgi:hypothetical protein
VHCQRFPNKKNMFSVSQSLKRWFNWLMLQLHHRASKSRNRTSTLSTDVPEACIITLSYNTARDYPSTDKSESIYSAGKYISKRKAMCEMLEGRINSQPHRKYAGKYHYLKTWMTNGMKKTSTIYIWNTAEDRDRGADEALDLGPAWLHGRGFFRC